MVLVQLSQFANSTRYGLNRGKTKNQKVLGLTSTFGYIAGEQW